MPNRRYQKSPTCGHMTSIFISNEAKLSFSWKWHLIIFNCTWNGLCDCWHLKFQGYNCTWNPQYLKTLLLLRPKGQTTWSLFGCDKVGHIYQCETTKSKKWSKDLPQKIIESCRHCVETIWVDIINQAIEHEFFVETIWIDMQGPNFIISWFTH